MEYVFDDVINCYPSPVSTDFNDMSYEMDKPKVQRVNMDRDRAMLREGQGLCDKQNQFDIEG